MYRVFVDGKLFCDSRLDDLALINPIVQLKVNSAGSFTFSITKEHPNYDIINKRTSSIEVYIEDDDEPIFEGVCVADDIDFYGQKKLTCEGSLSFLNDSILRPAHHQGLTSRQLLETYINEHNSQVDDFKQFEVGIVTAKDSNDYITCFTNYNSTMKEVKEDLVDDIGGYLRVRHENRKRIIDYLAESPRTSEQTIELGKNLLNYSSNLDTTQICTVLIPLGARTGQQVVPGLDDYVNIKSVNDGKDYIESESIETYGRVTQTVAWDGINTPEILKAKAEAYLSDEQFANVVLKITAIDFGLITDRFDRFRLLDMIRVISPTHGMDRYFMLTEQTLNLNSPERDTIVLGKDEKVSLSARTTSAAIKAEQAATSDMLASAIDNATNLLKGVEGGHIKIVTENGKPNEILVMDSDDESTATRIWRWNLNGFGYSNDGGQNYGTAITMDGKIVADYIQGGTINGVRIRGSEISASGVVRRYRSDYSQADVDRANNIIVGNITPTDADYEKLDLNCDNIIELSDVIMVRKLIEGLYGDYLEIECPVLFNGSNQMGTIKTKDVAINNSGIRTKGLNTSGDILFNFGDGIYGIDIIKNGERYDTVSGECRSADGHTLRFVNGLLTYFY